MNMDDLHALAEVIGNKGPRAEEIGEIAAARRVLGAGYRKPRVVTTIEELDALPVNVSIIGTSSRPAKWPGSPYSKFPSGAWFDYGNGYNVDSDDIRLPATVTYTPDSAA